MKLTKSVSAFFYNNYYIFNIISIVFILYYYYMENNGIVIGFLGFPFYFYKNVAVFLLIFSLIALIISIVYFELSGTSPNDNSEPINVNENSIEIDSSKETIHLIKFSNESIARITNAINEQNIKSRVNLLLGLGTALLGLGFIGFFIVGFEYNKYEGDIIKFLIDFIPRFSVLIVIEVLAYFFLRLYKINLDNIIKLQTEATVIEH